MLPPSREGKIVCESMKRMPEGKGWGGRELWEPMEWMSKRENNLWLIHCPSRDGNVCGQAHRSYLFTAAATKRPRQTRKERDGMMREKQRKWERREIKESAGEKEREKGRSSRISWSCTRTVVIVRRLETERSKINSHLDYSSSSSLECIYPKM